MATSEHAPDNTGIEFRDQKVQPPPPSPRSTSGVGGKGWLKAWEWRKHCKNLKPAMFTGFPEPESRGC